MNKHIVISTLCLGAMLGSCQRADDIFTPEPNSTTEIAQQAETKPQTSQKIGNIDLSEATVPDVVRVRFDAQTAEHIEQALSARGLRSLRGDVANLVDKLDAVELSRVFPYAGQYEERTRKEGLHLWYDIRLRPEADAQRAREAQQEAMQLAAQLSGVTFVEQVYRCTLPEQEPTLLTDRDMQMASRLRAATALPTDDPQLGMQWHYHNEGKFVRSKKGADINLFEAWKQEKGKKNVIVAIIDGGVDYKHEDLKENMYVNTTELNGTKGKDDDNNGLVDDVYGYNFANDNAEIVPHEHGTHVAGTVAARNNNGIGVAGVAGGDGSPESGIRMISCQVFLPKGHRPQSRAYDYFEVALKVAADMGAVISQNSWGNSGQSSYIPEARKKAIDYFIKYAGCDSEGNQRPDSPMKGGVVIFAAGNDGADFKASPASYPPVVSVSSMSFDFTVAPYSNRGDWVSIMAPGGNIYDHYGQVLSTLPDNRYGYFQGTSMACPHVSGIAALIVSKFGRQGFTNTELKQRLTHSILPVDINAMNPRYAGRLGAGYIDAAAALGDNNLRTSAPKSVDIETITPKQTSATISWLVSEDPDDGVALGYNLYVSPVKIEANQLNSELVKKFIRSDASKPKGATISTTISGMKHNTKYYFAIEAYDRWGNKSNLTLGEFVTEGNQAPSVTLPNGFEAPRLMGDETAIVKLSVKDPENNEWSAQIEGASYGAKLIKVKNELELHLRVVNVPGKYEIKVLVTDQLGGEGRITVPFEVYMNKAPKATKRTEYLTLELSAGTKDIDLDTLFTDPDGDKLTYTVRAVGKVTAECVVEGNKLKVSPKAAGLSGFMIGATDTKGNKASIGLEVRVK